MFFLFETPLLGPRRCDRRSLDRSPSSSVATPCQEIYSFIVALYPFIVAETTRNIQRTFIHIYIFISIEKSLRFLNILDQLDHPTLRHFSIVANLVAVNELIDGPLLEDRNAESTKRAMRTQTRTAFPSYFGQLTIVDHIVDS